MFALSGHIAAGGAGALLALGNIGGPPAEQRTPQSPPAVEERGPQSPPPVEQRTLLSIPPESMSVAAGGSARFDLAVRNDGTAPAEGAVLSLEIAPRLLARSYRNCTTEPYRLTCTFTKTLAPGKTYGPAESLILHPPADSITDSTAHVTASWMTVAEWKNRPALTPDSDHVWVAGPAWLNLPSARPQPGTGPELTLAERSAPPEEATVRGESFIVGVIGGRPADLAISGVRTTTPNGRGRVRVTLTNHGPGRLYPDLYLNNRQTITVTLPAGTRARSTPQSCLRSADDRELECAATIPIAGGEREHIDFRVRVSDPSAPSGRVEIADHAWLRLDDPSPSNNTADITRSNRTTEIAQG